MEPAIEADKQFVDALEGSPATLSCHVMPGDYNYEPPVYWSRIDKPEIPRNAIRKGRILHFPEVNASHEGDYKCHISETEYDTIYFYVTSKLILFSKKKTKSDFLNN